MEEVDIRRSSELSEALLIKAKEELGETDDFREECLIILREWIENHHNDYSHLGTVLKTIFVKGNFANGVLYCI